MESSRIREIFLALKLHYTSEKYDYTKFSNRKLKGAGKSDIFFYDKFAEKFKDDNALEFFFMSNMTKDFHKNFSIPTFIGDYYTKENFEYLKKWYAYVKKTLPDNYIKYTTLYSTEELIATGKTLPRIFEDYLQEKISLDILATFIYNNQNNDDIEMWDIMSQTDPLFDKLYLIVKKHALLMKKKQLL